MKRKKENCAGVRRSGFNALICLLVFTMMACTGNEVEKQHGEEQQPATANENSGTDEWDYENTNWSKIADSECRSNVQSPVDITPKEVIDANLATIGYEYSPFTMKIVDNGHSIQVFGTDNSFISVEGKRYQFKQFHFHAPAEHTIDKKRYPLEMHLVHKEEGSDNLAVLAIFIEESATENRFLEKIFANVPDQKEKEVVTEVQLTLSDYIPPGQVYYTYIGSLTTPPCTVGVDWLIFKEAIKASGDQIEKFKRYYDSNARPVQELNNRRVLKSME